MTDQNRAHVIDLIGDLLRDWRIYDAEIPSPIYSEAVYLQIPITLSQTGERYDFEELVRCAAHDVYRVQHEIEIG